MLECSSQSIFSSRFEGGLVLVRKEVGEIERPRAISVSLSVLALLVSVLVQY